MYEQNILDQQAFAREATIASAVANPYLESGKVLIAETGLFYDVVTTNSTGAIALTNGKFLKHIENLKINGNVLKGSITINASQVPQDANNRFITDTERTNWNNKSNKTVQMIAGNGLTGGGTLEANRTFNVVSANDGIVVNADNIQLNPVNALNSTSTTRPLTAAQGKALEDKKLNLSGGTMSGQLKSPSFEATSTGISGGFRLHGDGAIIANGLTALGFYIDETDTGYNNGWIWRTHNNGTGKDTAMTLSKTGSLTAKKFLGALQGNADTSTKLQTVRQINGTNFDGTGNITTAHWGTARTLTIGNTGKSVNGSGNVAWSLNEIGASLGQSISATTPATAGWYRIATTASGINRNGGVFTIHTTVSGHHSTTVLTAGINYSSGITLNQLSHSVFGSAITKARMVYHTTYSGNYAYLEVYLNAAVASSINVYVSNPIGWSLVAPNTAGSIPTGYTNYEITLATNKIVSDLNGNSSSATKLQTARTINGTNFDGTGNITTANWGTARTLTIGSTGKSVNGSANVSWSLAELGLGNVNNTADSAKNVLSATKLTTARAINIGGSSKNFDGTANLNWNYNDIGSFASIGSDFSATDASYGWVNGSVTNGKNITSFTGNILQFGQHRTTGTGNHRTQLLVSQSGGLHYRTLHGAQQTSIDFKRVYDTSYKPLADAATKLQTARTIGGVSFDGTANINLPGVNTAGNQSTSGNAATATKLQTTRAINGTNFDGTAAITTANWGTARNITIGNSTKSVNGSGNVGWSLSEIGAGNKHVLIDDANFDFNTIQETGTYASASDGVTANWKNKPCSGGFTWIVLRQLDNRRQQILWSATNEMWTRYQSANGNNSATELWTPWVRTYNTGYKPSKGDVGLGSVNNWGATGAVNDASDSKYATAGAVKKAYDLANTANTNANNSVKKAGDTMTGNLTLPYLKLTANDPKALLIEKGEYQAMYGVSVTVGDCVLGIKKKTAGDYEDYIRIGKNKLQYQTNGVAQNIYHTGNKPTAGDVGAIPVSNKGTLPGNTLGNTSGWNASGYDPGSYHRAYSGHSGVTFATPKVGGSTNQILMEMTYNGGFYLHSNTDSKAWTSHKVYTSSAKPTAADVGLGNVPNTSHTTAATANTVAVRDSSGDINVRLLRPNYADQSTISGAMAFRINNGSDNYIRFCNNVSNIRNWLGAAASSHTHSISQITGGTHSTITMTPNNTSGTYNTRSIELREVNNVTTGQSSDAYAPAIGWHWGGRYGKKLFMNASGRLVFDGDFSASKVYNAVWNDYAEYFPKLETTITEAGDIIALSLNDDGEFYELATEEHVMIVGAHSDQFGHIIGGENPENGESFEEYNNKKFIPVGLVGRLPVKFVGTARKGMKVVPSHIPGVGRKFDSSKDDYDKVIGYIVENNNDEGIRRVKIKIGK